MMNRESKKLFLNNIFLDLNVFGSPIFIHLECPDEFSQSNVN